MSEQIIWLDRLSDADLPPGAVPVDTETEFLRLAVGGQSLLVRGEALCDWAEQFYRGRSTTVRPTRSPVRALQGVFPDLSMDATWELLGRLGQNRAAVLDPHLDSQRLMEALFPMSGIWGDQPSREHAAEWLLWLYNERPSPAVQTAFQPLLEKWRNATIDPISKLYTAASHESSRGLLYGWLHARQDRSASELGEFPLDVPSALQAELRNEWRTRIIESQGAFFEYLREQFVPRRLLRVAAEETTDYLLQHPRQLTNERFAILAPHLDVARRRALGRHVPPRQPGPLPEAIPDILNWFERDYLPFRLWQADRDSQEAADVSQAAIEQFAGWYLFQYPQALTDSSLRQHLSFRQPLPYDPAAPLSTLVVVLDGLHAEDALHLRQRLEELAPRLQLLETKWVFAPVPTVTEFAKPALFAGLAPIDAGLLSSRAEILPERKDPTKRLEKTEPGQLFFWRVGDPDDTYHSKNNHDSLREEVESALEKIAKQVGGIVRQVPPEVRLRVVITTDHGRLLAGVPRAIPVPPDMFSHGRAAWGKRRHEFDETGVIIEGDMAFLHAQRYGLPEEIGEIAVIIGPKMFKTNDNKTGSELFPHGGVAPEEVIIPWWVFERDWQMPKVAITVTGKGTAGGKGQFIVQVMNPSDVRIIISRLHVRWPNGDIRDREIELSVDPRSADKLELEIEPWPSQAEAESLTATASLRLPDGKRFDEPVSMKLESEELYRRDNILEDLE